MVKWRFINTCYIAFVGQVQRRVNSHADTLGNKNHRIWIPARYTQTWSNIIEIPIDVTKKLTDAENAAFSLKCEQVCKSDQPTSATHPRPFPCWRMRRFNVEKAQGQPTSATHLRPFLCWRMRRFNMEKAQDQPTLATYLRPFLCWRMRRFNVEKAKVSSRFHSSVFQPISTNQSTVLVDIWSNSAGWVSYCTRYGLQEVTDFPSLPSSKRKSEPF